MKKIYILTLSFVALSINAQIRTNDILKENTANKSTAFLDVSSSPTWNNSVNIGKGLVFPRTDLVQLTSLRQTGPNIPTNFPTRMDGMVVYNTATGVPGIGASETPNVTPGFYYYKNTSNNDLQGGHWVRIKDANDVSTGVATGDFWSLAGNDNATAATIDPSTNEITAGSFIGTTNATSVTIGTEKIARLEIGEKTNETVNGTSGFNFVLDVYGKARFRDGIVTSASTYPDYVFDNYFTGKSDENPNYEFKKLNEVEKFIKENNHLPGVTSIKELTKSENGYNVDNTQLSIQTLEKVEELYLYVIEQQKEIQALKAEIAELKK